MKKLLLTVMLACGALLASAQDFPKAGIFTLSSGAYTLTILPGRNLCLGGLAYNGIQLFVSDTAGGGLVINQSKTKPELLNAKLTIDGTEPAKITQGATFKGKQILFERTIQQGGITCTERTALDENGVLFSVQYKATGEMRPSSVYPFTFPWNTAFTEFVTDDGGKGTCSNTGEWLIQGNPKYVALYRGDKSIGAIIGSASAIPTNSRKHTIWDHKSYHKYFVFLQLPTWKVGHESPEYKMSLQCFSENISKWQEKAHDMALRMPLASVAPASKEKGESSAKSAAPTSQGKRLNDIKIVPPGPVSGRMDWKTNRRGIEALDPDFVLPPFENVQCTAKGVKVWNREYRFGGNGLIGEARIANRNILVQPMRLEMVINGKPVVFKTNGAKLVSQHKGQAVYETPLECEEATLLVKATVEYDGMVRMDLRLTPKKELSLDHFSYAFNMANSRAKYIHYIGNPEQSGLSIMIGNESYSFEIPQKPGEFFAEPFKTLVWFGDEDEGFLWFSASEKNFSPCDAAARPKALCATRENGTSKLEGMTTFTVTPISRGVKISKPIDYTFGFFATPVRPMPRQWRKWFFTTRRAAYGSEASHGYVGNMPMIWPDETRSTAAPLFSAESEAKMKRFSDELHKAGRNALGYMDPIRVHMGYLKYLGVPIQTSQLNDLYLAPDPKDDAFLYRVPVVSENFNEWRTIPQVIYGYGASKGGREVRVSSASSWADFFCYLCECYAMLGYDGMGDIDNCFPIRDMNEAHNRGYVRFDGKRGWEWDWFERRDLMKRMAATFLKVRGKPGIIVAHASATWSIPFMSFCDANMTYEHSNSGYFSSDRFMSKYNPDSAELRKRVKAGDPTYLRLGFPPSRWRAELTGRQFGLPAIIMPNQTKSRQMSHEAAASLAVGRSVTAHVAAHDAIMWPIWINTAPMVTLQKIREGFGIEEDDVVFYPYWSQKSITTTAPYSISYYTRKGKALVVVANLTEKDAVGDVDFSKLGFKNIINAEDKQNATGKALAIKACDFAIFELTN